MDRETVKKRVHRYYREEDRNYAVTTLLILSEHFDIVLNDQVVDAAAGMHGAGKYGAQCGFLEGMVMFLGVLGKAHGFEKDVIEICCREFAELFEKTFGSLLCRVLRPGGFAPGNSPHPCERITCDAARLAFGFLGDII